MSRVNVKVTEVKVNGQGRKLGSKVARFKVKGSKVQGLRSRSWVKVKGCKGRGQRSRSCIKVKRHGVKVKVAWGAFYPIDSREVRHVGVLICSIEDY